VGRRRGDREDRRFRPGAISPAPKNGAHSSGRRCSQEPAKGEAPASRRGLIVGLHEPAFSRSTAPRHQAAGFNGWRDALPALGSSSNQTGGWVRAGVGRGSWPKCRNRTVHMAGRTMAGCAPGRGAITSANSALCFSADLAMAWDADRGRAEAHEHDERQSQGAVASVSASQPRRSAEHLAGVAVSSSVSRRRKGPACVCRVPARSGRRGCASSAAGMTCEVH